MGKKRAVMTDSLRHKYIREGRGQGTGSQYLPWLTIHNVPSSGIVFRVRGNKTKRIHHYLSRLEYMYHVLLDNDPLVLDIREQFPLKLKDTLRISEQLDFRHPSFGKELVVCTTDFLITAANNTFHARAVKHSEALSDPRVLEKLSIELLYWKELGIEWKIVTEKDLDMIKAENLIWLNSGENLSQICQNPATINMVLEDFMALYSNTSVSFDTILEAIESHYKLQPGTAIAVFKTLVRDGHISLNLSIPINFSDPRINSI